MNPEKFNLAAFPVHLALGAQVLEQAKFTGGMEWYEAYGALHHADGAEGRLVSVHRFDAPWNSWEMHPNGEELVVCLAGEMHIASRASKRHRYGDAHAL